MIGTANLRLDAPIGTISPGIYSHFIEHLGDCVYGGLWVGPDDTRETVDGVRTDTLELFDALEPPVVRWPGGCFADYYHWEDGIGPREERPRRVNLLWDQEEPNTFGTDEFLRTCEHIDTEPFIAVNVGTGSEQEALAWMEYCNYDGDSEYANLRRENGHPEPYDVRYWAVGNENWGCGGQYDPIEYANELRRYSYYLRALSRRTPTDIDLVATGHSSSVTWGRRYGDEAFAMADHDWNKVVLEALDNPDYSFSGMKVDALDSLSIHRYVQAGPSCDFSDEQYYRLFAEAEKIEGDVARAAKLLDVILPRDSVDVIVDEYGVWHPEFDPANGEWHQHTTVRDALALATILDGFNRRADVVSMANIAMPINVLHCLIRADEDGAWATPSYHVFDLYRPHRDGTAVPIDVGLEDGRRLPSSVSIVSASASHHTGPTGADEASESIYVTLSNRHLDESIDLNIGLGTATDVGDVAAEVLYEGLDVDEHDRTGDPARFEPTDHPIDGTGRGSVRLTVPPSAVVGLNAEVST